MISGHEYHIISLSHAMPQPFSTEEVDPYHAAIARTTIELAGLTVAWRKFQEEAARAKQNPHRTPNESKMTIQHVFNIFQYEIRWQKYRTPCMDDMDV